MKNTASCNTALSERLFSRRDLRKRRKNKSRLRWNVMKANNKYSRSRMLKIKLNSGYEMPQLGIGIFMASGNEQAR
ncbi:MAG: hypothetical protein Q4E24_14590 [bacterium]|nr:hypothetical protein [bacterium]